MNDVDVLIAGGGISGLATAWWLAREGLTVEVWEREPYAGGKIQTDRTDGYVTERAATMVMNFRPEVNQLITESGVATDKVLPVPARNRYVLHDGGLIAVPMRLGALISSPLWSLRGKLRLLAEPLLPKGGHEEETVSQFITRRLGREVLEKAMEPYVGGVLAADPDLANAYAVLPRLTALERRYGSLTLGVLAHRILRWRTGCPTESFSFRDGMSTLVESLANTRGVRLRLGRTVAALTPNGARGWCAIGNGAQREHTLRARQVVLSVPADVAASVLAPLDAELAKLLHGIDYAPLSVVHLGFDRSAVPHPLDGTGFLAPRQEGLMLNGSLWMSALFADRAPPGKVLLTTYLGGTRSPQVIDWNDQHSVGTVMRELGRLLGIKATPEMVHINRHRHALPLYHGAYHGRSTEIAEHLQHLPGLHLEANYRNGVSVRDRIVSGNHTAKRILSVIGHSARVSSNRVQRQRLVVEPGT